MTLHKLPRTSRRAVAGCVRLRAVVVLCTKNTTRVIHGCSMGIDQSIIRRIGGKGCCQLSHLSLVVLVPGCQLAQLTF